MIVMSNETHDTGSTIKMVPSSDLAETSESVEAPVEPSVETPTFADSDEAFKLEEPNNTRQLEHLNNVAAEAVNAVARLSHILVIRAFTRLVEDVLTLCGDASGQKASSDPFPEAWLIAHFFLRGTIGFGIRNCQALSSRSQSVELLRLECQRKSRDRGAAEIVCRSFLLRVLPPSSLTCRSHSVKPQMHYKVSNVYSRSRRQIKSVRMIEIITDTRGCSSGLIML